MVILVPTSVPGMVVTHALAAQGKPCFSKEFEMSLPMKSGRSWLLQSRITPVSLGNIVRFARHFSLDLPRKLVNPLLDPISVDFEPRVCMKTNL